MKIFQSFLKSYEIRGGDQTLGQRLRILEEKYSSLLQDVVRLEEENLELKTHLNELEKNIEAVDARIDILVVEKFITGETQND